MAAIAVMALLVSELENIQISHVLPIGSGGDYAVRMSRDGQLVQLEVSGIKEGHPSRSIARLQEKCEQVVKKCSAGFASVTTFRQIQGKGGIAHSFLHHVELKRRREKQS